MNGLNSFFGSQTRKIHDHILCDNLLLEFQNLQNCFWYYDNEIFLEELSLGTVCRSVLDCQANCIRFAICEFPGNAARIIFVRTKASFAIQSQKKQIF